MILIENNRIKEIRLEKGISLSDLASKSGVSAGYICHLENGSRKNPSVVIMKKIAHALGKNIIEVFNIE